MVYALLIDDDTQITQSAIDLVRDQGLTLETANSWDEGLEKFYALSPDLVISDFNLPGSEMGLNLLLKISKLRPSVRLILLSAYLNEEDADRIRELDLVHDVVRKISPVETARRIIEEVRQASLRAGEPTDWKGFAAAAGRIQEVDEGALEALDRYLRVNRLPGARDE